MKFLFILVALLLQFVFECGAFRLGVSTLKSVSIRQTGSTLHSDKIDNAPVTEANTPVSPEGLAIPGHS